MATKIDKLDKRVSDVEGDVKAIDARDVEREKHRDKFEKSVSDKFGAIFEKLDAMPATLLATMEDKAQQEDGKIINKVLVGSVLLLLGVVGYLITQGAPWAEAHAEIVTSQGVDYVFSRK